MNQRIFTLFTTRLVLSCFQPVEAVEVGDKVPDCLLTSISDLQHFELKQLNGQKVLYLDFWASWCSPCAQSFPFLNDLNQGLKEKGLQVVGINMDQEPGESKAFLAKFPANFPVYSDIAEKCATDFDVKVMPSSYLVDRKGIIRHVHFGFRSGDVDELRTLVDQLLAEKR